MTRLSLAFLALIGGFFVFRSLTVPASFGAIGFYRGKAPQMIASAPMKHAGKQICVDCHDDKATLTPHVKKGVACESCHGPALGHTEDPSSVKPFKPQERQFCARCHAKIPGRRASFPQVDVKTHNPDVRCIDCHEIHPAEAPKGGEATK